MVTITRHENAALALLDALEAQAALFDGRWVKQSVFIESEDGMRPCLAGPGAYLVPLENAEGVLEAYGLLLDNAHLLISLARIAVEANLGRAAGLPALRAWPPKLCRYCAGTRLVAMSPRPGVYRVSCQDCGQEMTELAPAQEQRALLPALEASREP